MSRIWKQAARQSFAAVTLCAGLCAAQVGIASASAQQSSSPVAAQPTARLTQQIDDAARITLKGNTHPLANPRNDRGMAAESLPTGRMLMVLKRSSQQDAALKSFLDAVHDPASPQYHKFLTPEQFGQQYGVADADIQTISGWLQNQGFSVDKVNKARTVIQFSGTAGQVQRAFNAPVHRYIVDNVAGVSPVEHYATASDPQIPAALAPVVAGIASLNNFSPHATNIRRGRVQYDPKTHQTSPLHPDVTLGSGSNLAYAVGPADFATIYNANPVYAQKDGSGAAVNGKGVTIGVIGDSNINTADVDNYRSFFSLPAATPQVIIDGNDPGLNGDEVEALLDTEIAGGVAPGANIVLYTAADTSLDFGLFLALQRALDDNTANIINLSFGECEAFLGSSGNSIIQGYWQEAAAQGISVTVSSDDSGSAGCDDANTEALAENGLAVNGLASTPYNIAVGGTDFNQNASNAGNYWNTTNGNGYLSAKGYIPEIPWNDSTTTIGQISGDSDAALKSQSPPTVNIVGAGGGVSDCTASTSATTPSGANTYTCTPGSGYPKPSWQSGSPNDGHRDLPDVSLLSADFGHSVGWALCLDGTDPTTGQAFTDCQGSNPTLDGVGGTSAAAPAMAGVLALIDQKYGPQGQADYVLYKVAAQHASVFHDITNGNNAVPCATTGNNLVVTGKASQCVPVSASGSDPYLNGYNAGTGYDLATGLGSFDVSALFTNWASVTLQSSATTLAVTKTDGTALPASIVHGTPVNVSSTVTSSPSGGSPTPTGLVALLGPNNAGIGTLILNSSGTGAQNNFNDLPGGTYQLFARYSGDGVYSTSKSNGISLTVTPEASTLNLVASTPSANGTLVSVAGQTVQYGTYIALEAQPVSTAYQAANNSNNPAPSNATGSITFTDSAQALPAGTGGTAGKYAINSNDYAEVPLNYLNVGSHSVSASYPGDASYNSSTAGPVGFTITQAPTTTSLASSTPTPAAGSNFTLTIGLGTSVYAAAAAPTGTLTVKSGTTTLGSPVSIGASGATPGQDANGNWTVSTQIQVAAGTLASGANSLTATYSGDTNYAGSTSTVVNVTGPGGGAGAIALTSSGNITVAAGATTGNTATITVTPSGGFSGAVALTCNISGGPTGATLPGCSLSPASVNVSGTTAGTSTLAITSTARTSGATHAPVINTPWWRMSGGAALACVLLFGIPARRRRWQSMLGLLFVVLAIGASGCGGGGGSGGNGGGGGGGGGGTTGTTAGTYSVKVSGADSTGKITATTNLNVTVQ